MRSTAIVLVVLLGLLASPSTAQFGSQCGTSRAVCTGFFTYRFCTNGVPTGPEQRCASLLVCDANQGPDKLPCKYIGG